MQDDPVAVDALAGRPARLDAADGAERLEQHPLELGQLHHVAGGVADGREVAHLRHHEEALVARVALRDRPEQVDVLDRGEPLEVEVLQPVQLQALRHHRVGVAEERLLGVAPARGRAEREVLHAARPGHRDHDPAERPRQGDPGEDRADLGGVRLGVAGALRPPEEDVAHQLPVRPGGDGREAAHAARARPRGPRRRVREEGVPAPPLARVAGDRERDGRPRSRRGARRGRGSGRSAAAAPRGSPPAPAGRPPRSAPPAARRAAAGTARGSRRGRPARRRPGPSARAREVALGRGEGLAAHALEQRPLDEPEAHLAREVVDRRVAALRRRDQPVEQRRQLGDRGERRGLSVEEALEQQRHRGGELLFPLVRLADAVEALLELGRAGEVADAVVPQGPLQLGEEGGGQPGPLLVQLAQVGEEVLLRPEAVAVLPLLLVLALAPEERADVHEDVEDAGAPRARRPRRRSPRAGRESASRRPAASTSNPSISPRSSSSACREPAGGPAAAAPSASRCSRRSRGSATRRGSGSMTTSGSPGPTCTFGTTRTSRTCPPKGASTEVSIFIASRTSRGCPASTSSPGLHGHRHHDRRSGSHDQPLRVAGEGVGHALHLDEVRAALHEREHAPARARAEQAPLGGLEAPLPQGGAQPLDAHVHAAAVLLHPVAVHGGAPHRDPVGLPALPQLHRARGLGPHLRPPARGGGQEARLLGVRLGLVGLDRGAHQRQLGVAARGLLPARDEAVEEAHVEPPRAHLLAVEEVEQERLVRRAPAQDDRRLGEAAREAPERLLAVAPVRDHLRDHRVELGRDEVALGDARVDAQARAARAAAAARPCPGPGRSRPPRPPRTAAPRSRGRRRAAARRAGGRPAPRAPAASRGRGRW